MWDTGYRCKHCVKAVTARVHTILHKVRVSVDFVRDVVLDSRVVRGVHRNSALERMVDGVVRDVHAVRTIRHVEMRTVPTRWINKGQHVHVLMSTVMMVVA